MLILMVVLLLDGPEVVKRHIGGILDRMITNVREEGHHSESETGLFVHWNRSTKIFTLVDVQ